MKNSTNESTNTFNYDDPIEVVIKKVYKLKGTELEKVDNNELIISEEDMSLIKIDIIIDIPTDL